MNTTDQFWIDSYNEIVLKYNKSNSGKLPHDFMYKSNQEQLADDLFDRFYEQAKVYAQSVPDTDNLNSIYNDLQIETLLSIKWVLNSILNVDFIKSSNSTDDSVFRRFLEQFRKVLTIILTKPKFTRLLKCPMEQSNGIIKLQVNQALLTFQALLAQRTGLSSNIKKGEVLNCLQSIVELINYYISTSSNSLSVGNLLQYFQINIVPLVIFSSSLENNQVYRQISFNILSSLPKAPFRQQILKLLSQVANDQYSLDFLWMNGGIDDNESIQILLSRIPSSHTMDLSRNLLITLSNALKSKTIELRGNNDKMEILYTHTLFQFIDSFWKKKQTNPDAQDSESLVVPFEVIDILSSMVKHSPDNHEVLKKVLSFGTNEETIAILMNNSEWFSKRTWIQVLLPFLRECVDGMKLQGVSGIQAEQSVIDCIRECARLFYLNSLISISYEDSHELGHILLKSIVDAMRHGYIETERFPMVCSIIILNHLPESINWFARDLLNPEICNSLKTSRAIFDIFLRLMGFIDIEESTTLSETKPENIHRIFHNLVQIPSHTTCSLVSACLFYKSGKRFLSDNPLYINLLIQSIKDIIVEALDNESYLSVDQAEAITECIKNLSLIVHPFDSPLLFNLSLQTLSMVPPQFASAFGDETLSRMVDKVSDGVPLCMSDIELGLKIGGPETRYSLCGFVPQLCILDKDPYIRCQALRAIAKREDLIITHFNEIIDATKVQNASAFDLELCISASPMMPIIASIEKTTLPECFQILYKAIRLSSVTDPQSRPDQRPIDCLNQVMDDITLVDILFCFKANLNSALYKLKRYSKKLKSLLNELSKRGVIQKNKKTQEYQVLVNSKGSTDDGASLNSASNYLYDQCKLFENTDIHKSISILLKLKKDYREFFDSQIRQQYLREQFLPRLLKSHFQEVNRSTVTISESFLDQVQNQQHIYRELLNIFDSDLESSRKQFESVINVNKKVVVVEYFLEIQKDPTSARKWLKDNLIRDQSLLMIIEKYENNILSSSLNSSYLDLEKRSNSVNVDSKYVIKPNLYDHTTILMKSTLANILGNTNSSTLPNSNNNNQIKQVEVEMNSLHIDNQQIHDDIEIYNPEREEKNWSKILSFQGKHPKNTYELTPLLGDSPQKSSSKSKKLLISS